MKIESPLVAFNNVIHSITNELTEIFEPKLKFKTVHPMIENSEIIFLNNSLIIKNIFKLSYKNNEINIHVLQKNLKREHLHYMNILYNRFDEVNIIFMRYIQMFNSITGYDDVPLSLIEKIISEIKRKDFASMPHYLLPYKNKLCKTDLEFEMDFDLMISFKQNSSTMFEYLIWRVDINEDSQTRFNEKELLFNEIVSFADTEQFIKNLFNYGNIIRYERTKSTSN